MAISLVEQELSRLLAARSGHFQFESGHHGNLWLDLDALLLYPSRLLPFIAELATRFAKYKVQAVCGPLVGGAFLAQSLATAMHVEFSFTERIATADRQASSSVTYRIPSGLRGRLHGERVAIVDDAINAGWAVRDTLTDYSFAAQTRWSLARWSCWVTPLSAFPPNTISPWNPLRSFRAICGHRRNVRCAPPRRRWRMPWTRRGQTDKPRRAI